MNYLAEKSNWFSQKIKCVILAGGKGTRLLPESLDKQKAMIEVSGKPILGHIIDYWSQFTDDFIFVVKFKKETIIDYVKTLSIKASFVEPESLRGIADGVLQVESLIDDRFIVVLGDCVCQGQFNFPKDFDQGIGVYQTSDEGKIRKSYSVEVKDERVIKVVEKPQVLVNNLCGMGYYFFNRQVFDFIKKTPASDLRHEVEITDVIQRMIDEGKNISPIYFEGKYKNINTAADLTIELEDFFA